MKIFPNILVYDFILSNVYTQQLFITPLQHYCFIEYGSTTDAITKIKYILRGKSINRPNADIGGPGPRARKNKYSLETQLMFWSMLFQMVIKRLEFSWQKGYIK